MKELRDLKDLTIHDVQPISDEYSQVDMLGLRYKPVDFGAEKSPGSPNW